MLKFSYLIFSRKPHLIHVAKKTDFFWFENKKRALFRAGPGSKSKPIQAQNTSHPAHHHFQAQPYKPGPTHQCTRPSTHLTLEFRFQPKFSNGQRVGRRGRAVISRGPNFKHRAAPPRFRARSPDSSSMMRKVKGWSAVNFDESHIHSTSNKKQRVQGLCFRYCNEQSAN